jgi:hypothetical protein
MREKTQFLSGETQQREEIIQNGDELQEERYELLYSKNVVRKLK